MGFYTDEDGDEVHFGRIIASIVGLMIVAGLAWYALVYASADTRGRVALHNQQRDPSALQFNYEYFHDTCHKVIAQTQQVATLQAQVDNDIAHPPASDPFGQYQSRIAQEQNDLTGLKNVRDGVAQEYNSRSHQFTRDFMKSNDLPDEIGPPTGVAYAQLKCEGNQS